MSSSQDGELFSDEEFRKIVKELSLSTRQAELIKLLLRGDSDEQIAHEMHIAVPTVRTHLSRLFNKYDLQDRHEIVIYIFRAFRKGCQRNKDGCPRWLKNMEKMRCHEPT